MHVTIGKLLETCIKPVWSGSHLSSGVSLIVEWVVPFGTSVCGNISEIHGLTSLATRGVVDSQTVSVLFNPCNSIVIILNFAC